MDATTIEGTAPDLHGLNPAARRRSRPVIGDIEILRGIAISMVLLEHLPLNLLWWKSRLFRLAYYHWHGAMGVDLFFAISGFVIARGLLPQLHGARNAAATVGVLWRFWVRRIFRLLPAAWLWLAIPLAASWQLGLFGSFGDFHRNITTTAAGLLNITNLYMATSHGPWGGPSIVYWSLSQEEQFYVVMPLVALLAGRFLPAVLAGVVVYQFTMPLTPLVDLTRPGALAVGVLLAIAAERGWFTAAEPKFLGRSRLARLAFVVAGVWLLGVLGVKSTSVKLGEVALVAGALVFIASFDRDYLWPENVSGRALRWIGSRSYALYLTHMSAYLATHQLVRLIYGFAPPHHPWLDLAAIAFALSLAFLAADLTHRLVERPFKRLGRRLTA